MSATIVPDRSESLPHSSLTMTYYRSCCLQSSTTQCRSVNHLARSTPTPSPLTRSTRPLRYGSIYTNPNQTTPQHTHIHTYTHTYIHTHVSYMCMLGDVLVVKPPQQPHDARDVHDCGAAPSEWRVEGRPRRWRMYGEQARFD